MNTKSIGGLNAVSFPSKSMNTLLATLAAAIILIGATIYLINANSAAVASASIQHLDGRPLATYDDVYPVGADKDGRLVLDKERFMKAVEFFTRQPSPRPISELIYLGQANNITLALDDASRAAYNKLASNPAYADFSNSDKHRDRVLQVYRDIVDGIGETLAGTGTEIVLHDTRNPVKSVVALQNPISGRRLGDTNTNFGLELIKAYSDVNRPAGSFISYGLTLKDGRNIKSTTVPLFDDNYGLVGFICMNIDISKLDQAHPESVEKFVENFKMIRSNQKISELIENSKHPK